MAKDLLMDEDTLYKTSLLLEPRKRSSSKTKQPIETEIWSRRKKGGPTSSKFDSFILFVDGLTTIERSLRLIGHFSLWLTSIQLVFSCTLLDINVFDWQTSKGFPHITSIGLEDIERLFPWRHQGYTLLVIDAFDWQQVKGYCVSTFS